MSNNELVKYSGNLPVVLEDLTRFVLIGREKLASVRAEIRAINKIEVATGVRDQKKQEAQSLAEALLDAEARIGELTKVLPKQIGGDRRSEEFQQGSGAPLKNEAIKGLGFSSDQVKRFEQLADNRDIIEQAKAEARANDDIVSRTQVLNMIKLKDQIKNEHKKIDINFNEKKKIDDMLTAAYQLEGVVTDYRLNCWHEYRKERSQVEDAIEKVDIGINELTKLRHKLGELLKLRRI